MPNNINPAGITRRAFLKGAAASVLSAAALGAFGGSALAAADEPQAEGKLNFVDYEVIDTDLLVVGCGWGGISAVFQAIALGQKVAVVDKGPYRHGGAAGYNWDLYIPFLKSREIMMYAASISTDRSLNNTAWNNCLATDPYINQELTQLRRGEVLPRRNEDGTQAYYAETPATVYVEGCFARTGQDILASNPLVSIFDRTMITDLLIVDGKCCGAVGLYLPTGQVKVFRAKATITATGATTAFIGWTGVCAHSINGMDNTGDADMAAYRHGAGIGHSESSGMDFISTYPTGMGYGWSMAVNPDSLEPDTYADRNGNHIFDREKDADIIAIGASDRAQFNSFVAKVLTDPEKATDDGGLLANLQGVRLRHFAQLNLKQFEKFGIDPINEMIPIHDEQYERGGQPCIDDNLMSEIPGLFCARGAGTTSVAMGGTIATYNIPFGAYATRCAVEYIKNLDAPAAMDFSSAEAEINRLEEIRTRKVEGGKRPFEVRHMIQNACDHCCGLVRKKEDMEEALAELKRIRKEEMPLMVLADETKSFNTEWKEAIENYNLLDAAELMVQASLLREESIHGTFFRPDFPEPGGEEWNCMLVGRWSEDGPVFEKKQYPLLGEE